jgi:hypothetical protein
MSEFKPDVPIGPSSEPDSPVFPASARLEGSVEKAAEVTCQWQGHSYRKGAQVCLNGHICECTDQGWSDRGVFC